MQRLVAPRRVLLPRAWGWTLPRARMQVLVQVQVQAQGLVLVLVQGLGRVPVRLRAHKLEVAQGRVRQGTPRVRVWPQRQPPQQLGPVRTDPNPPTALRVATELR